MYRNLSILIIFVLIICCSGNKTIFFDRNTEIDNIIYLESVALNLDSAYFRYPYRIAIKENIIVIHDLHNVDNYLHAYTFPEGEHIASFVPRGQGAGEMTVCERFQFVSQDSIWALDPNKLSLQRWSISTQDKSAKMEESLSLDKWLIHCQDIIVRDEGFITPDYSAEYRYNLLDWSGQIHKKSGLIPTEKEQPKKMTMAQAWKPFMAYDAKTKDLIMVTQLGEVIEIYNLENNNHIVKYGPAGEPQYQTKQNGDYTPIGIMGFSDVQITDNYIYAVFDGITMKEIEGYYRRGETRQQGGKQIYVFDREANPVKKYLLDRPVHNIYIDEENNCIYGLDVNENEPLYRFDLPH